MTEDFERRLHDGILAAIGKATEEYLSRAGYGDNRSPLVRIIESEIERREPALRALIGEAIDHALSSDFRQALRDAAAHKLARVIMSKTEGEIEKRANELRSDAAFRARLTLAIEAAIKGV